MSLIQIDPEFQLLIPPLSTEEHVQLEANLLKDGCREKLVVWNGILIDGHNRHEICTRLDIPFETTSRDFDDRDSAKLWIIENQMGRRNLNAFVRAELALVAEPIIAERAKANQKQGRSTLTNPSVVTREEISKKAHVSTGTMHKVRAIKKNSPQDVQEQVRAGEISINQAFKEIKRSQVRKERVNKIVSISEGNKELKTDKKYPVILCDPPWEYDHSVSSNRDIENHYPTMKLQDITELPVENLSTPDAVIFLWATSPKLQEAIHIMGAWGFEYRTCMVWVKDKIGMGYYARQRHELLLIGSKGDMPCPEAANRPDSIIEAPRGSHSEKPAIVHSLIEKMYPEFERIELFSRAKRDNWAAWGNQA